MGHSFLQHAQLEIVILYIVLTTQGVILLFPELYNIGSGFILLANN